MRARHPEYTRGVRGLLKRVERNIGKEERTEPEEDTGERKRTRCDQSE